MKIIIVSILFFVSGFTSLIYQIIWQKKVYTIMGSDVFATSMTLSAFMLGLALGSYLIGKIADHINVRLRFYGVLEIIIGVYALLFVPIINIITPFLHSIYRNNFNNMPLIYYLTKFLIIFLILLLPTVLMGATLPLIVRCFIRYKDNVKDLISDFYGINTAGAFTGALISGFVLVRYLGISKAVLIAVVFNLIIGFTALLLGREDDSTAGKLTDSESISEERSIVQKKYHRYIFITSAFIIGFSILALEVIWTRMLVQYFSATVYSFSIMLLIALLGIFWGSFRSKVFTSLHEKLLRKYTILLIVLGIYVTLSALLFYKFPVLYNRFVFILIAIFKSKNSWFMITSIGKVIVAGIFIFPPCFISGILFPLTVELYNNEKLKIGHTASRIYSANTLGSVLGPLAAGLILIPLIGIRASMVAVAFVLILLAVLIAVFLLKEIRKGAFIVIAVNIVLIIIILLQPVQVITNYSFINPETKKIFHREGYYQTISIVRNKKGQTVFMIDGNVEADNHPVQLRQFVLKGHLPLLLHEEESEVLVVGLGMGITLKAIEKNPWVKSVDLVELSPEVINAQRYLRDVNNDVLNFEKLKIISDDGRNYLSAIHKKYDVINIDPIHPRISGVGTLYTKEFYELVKSRLKKDGIFIQWMPSYQMSPKLFKIAVNTFYQTFKKSILWYVKGHFLMVGFNGNIKFNYSILKEKFECIKDDLINIGISSIEDLLAFVAMSAKNLKSFTKDINEVNTDDNLILEYFAPGDYLYRVDDIIQHALDYFNFPSELLVNIGQKDKEHIEALWKNRKTYVLKEASESIN